MVGGGLGGWGAGGGCIRAPCIISSPVDLYPGTLALGAGGGGHCMSHAIHRSEDNKAIRFVAT